MGFFGALVLAFFAGVLLNLTPCVLPAIPLKIRTIAHEVGSARRQRMFAASAFTAGTLLFFGTLGAATAALSWTWGTLFQSPFAVGVLVAVLLAFAVTSYWLESMTKPPQPAYGSQSRFARFAFQQMPVTPNGQAARRAGEYHPPRA